MDLPVSSFVCQSSLLTVKSVELAVVHDGLNRLYFHSDYFDCRGAFRQFLIRTAV